MITSFALPYLHVMCGARASPLIWISTVKNSVVSEEITGPAGVWCSP